MGELTLIKFEILNRGMTQKFVARKAGIREPVFSQIARGKLIPNKIQRAKIAGALQIPEKELFRVED